GFDDRYTAPHNGFGTASNYYYQASATRVIDRIAIPTLIVSAVDDPFVPQEIFDVPEVRNNPHSRVDLLPHGGHCAFLSQPCPDDDGYCAESAINQFAQSHTHLYKSSITKSATC